MRIGLAQFHPQGEPIANLGEVEQIIERGGQAKIDLLCFSHDFLGPDVGELPDAVTTVRSLAARHDINILTGQIRTEAGDLAQSVFIERDGRASDWVPLGEIRGIETCLGSTMVLTEQQAYSPKTDISAARIRPRAMLMQTNAISLLELEAIKKLAVDRSFNQAHLVICASDVGQYADDTCLGNSMAVFQGEIIAEAETDAPELVDFTVDLSKFIDYDILRDSVVIPELLRQKFKT